MKRLKSILFAFIAITLCGCNTTDEEIFYSAEKEIVVERSYSEVSEYELFWETMFDVDLPLYYVYFYSTTCNHCQELKNYMIEKALENKNIYFVKGSNKDQIGNDENLSKNAENPGDIWILGYPSLIQIKGKKCAKNLAGINQIKGELK